MDPQMLFSPESSVLPAPYWFIEFFKVLGFTLHTVPMNLWFAGTMTAMILAVVGTAEGRRFSRRLMMQMPVIIAFGINFGIVPLLFIQVAFYKAFFPATILTAWFWMAIIGLLIFAYYGVYIYASGLRGEMGEPHASAGTPTSSTGLTGWKVAAGWVSAVLFIIMGWLFSNGFSLMENTQAWPELLAAHHVAGAATGTASNAADPALWARWLMMFSLALLTTSAWIRFDAAWLTTGDSQDTAAYRRWAAGFAPKLATAGLLGFAAMGSWYVFGTWSDTLFDRMFSGGLLLLTLLTAAAPGLTWLVLVVGWKRSDGVLFATGALLAQVVVLAVNAISRQVVQRLELQPMMDPLSQPVATQWGPITMFLGTFVLGAIVIGWMLVQAVAATRPAR